MQTKMISKVHNSYVADAVGLIVLAGIMPVASFFVPGSKMPDITWLFIYFIWAAGALFVWHHPKAPSAPTKWLLFALYSVVAAALWFGLATLGARMMFTDEPIASEAFDLTVTVVISPGLTVVALLGSLRTVVLHKRSAI